MAITTETDLDVAIIGAGLSGIGMAAHMQMRCPDRSFALFERRADIGGTWDLFRYPGVRSDSDMHTLGFGFEPWTDDKSIADGDAILRYLNHIVDDRGIRPHIRFGTRILSADWNPASARWVIVSEEADGQRHRTTARFLYIGAGYYDYDALHDAQIPGIADFSGTVVHPQFWPAGLDHAGKRVVVIGSGATAVTLVPALAETSAHVTMLQRTPTWCGIMPAQDKTAIMLRRFLPARLAYKLVRLKNTRMQDFVFRKARSEPAKVGGFLKSKIKEALGDKYDSATWTAPYGPWDQRLCLVPDGDLFAAIRAGKADVVTDHIDHVDATGIRLASGSHLGADIIVTATGLRIATAGKIAISLAGVPVNFADHYWYKGCMFSNVPNLAMAFGYLNASWTLRADLTADYICRVLNAMKARRSDVAVPVLPADENPGEDNVFDFSSGYLRRSLHMMPKSAPVLPWRLNQDYLHDKRWMKRNPVEDGILRLEPAGASAGMAQKAE